MLNRSHLRPNPFEQFELWLNTARTDKRINLPEAMTLATASKAGVPSARIVLLRGVDARGFVFYTNYDSQKGQELAENPQAALVFYWEALGRQIRLTGHIERISDDESDRYFQSRPRGSQLGAWASRQSEPIGNRAMLADQLSALEEKFRNQDVPRPPFWGGFRLAPNTIDFWQSGPDRLHDWFRYTHHPDQSWQIERISP